ncbi:MAG TPA: S41 family peptidase [Verrucomicrobiae bacterium]|jgi:carboxyl-terminal processing protease|nr:S41 family peptidase [Verrucomicrobiae bacterium]
MSKKIQVLLLTTSILIVGFVLVGGLGVHASSSNEESYTHLQVYSEVLYHVRAEYVEEPNMSLVTSGALHGMLESLDANSSYLSPAEYKAFKENKSTGKANIGATVSKRFGYAAVVSVIPGGPADKAGIGSGDILEAIDTQSTHDMSLAAIKNRLTGDAGSHLDVSVIRARRVEPQKVTLVREETKPPAVQGQMLADNIGYVKTTVLTPGRASEIENKIKDLQKAGAKKLVLDLRNTSAGDEEEGVAAANLFLDHGLIAYVQGQKYAKITYNADPQKKITDLPLVVLVNHGTAGAAEIVAAAILDNKRGDVLGDKTFGDGSVQKLLDVPDGSALILSIAKYYTPGGKVIQDTGITPNIVVASASDLVAAVDDEDGGNEEPQKTTPANDDQLNRAIQLLKAKGQKT